MDLCPSCGAPLSGRTLNQSLPGDRAAGRGGRELRRCPACRRLAQRYGRDLGSWADGGTDPSVDYLFDWEPEPLPEPWILASPDIRALLETELRAELAEGHPLFKTPVTAIARCPGCDDVLFSVEADPAWFALVHLTWRRAQETPPWPKTENVTLPLSRSLSTRTH